MKLIFHAAYFLLGGETLLKHKEGFYVRLYVVSSSQFVCDFRLNNS